MRAMRLLTGAFKTLRFMAGSALVNLRFIREALGALVTFKKEPVPTVFIQYRE